METSDVERAVRLVLPALDLEPAGFRLDRGFVSRAERSRGYLGSAVNRIECQFVFIGLRAAADPAQELDSVVADALAWLPDPVRTVCESLVIAWVDSGGAVFAAALDVSASDKPARLLGSSWAAPEAWPEPTIDAAKSGEEILKAALDRLESTVRNRRDNPGSAFPVDLERVFRVVDIALLRFGGEGQVTSAHPAASASDESWSAWLARYNRSVRDEWKRVRRGAATGTSGGVTVSLNGLLAGLRVFLSYARPDATALAWPIYETLSSCGAEVWFDQERGPDESQLAAGFAETIGRCDVYIMCATDEFVERAGYATQEFAWAMQQYICGGRTRHFLVVAWPETILPAAVAGWPVVEFRGGDLERLGRDLIGHLQRPAPAVPPGATPVPLAVAAPAAVAPLPAQADLRLQLRRAQHVLRFDEVDHQAVERLISRNEVDNRHSQAIEERLLHVGDGLDWAGTFKDLDRWPDDPLIRDLRFRLAGMRAVVGARRSLDGDLDWGPGVAPEVMYLATHPTPALFWPAVPGWDDSARRFALRHHAGLLRILSELLRRGLADGILDVSDSTIGEWSEELVKRRRECVDGLLALRLDFRLTWRRDPPEWDAIFRSWRKLLLNPACKWREPVPFTVLQLLVANVTEVAAVGAETCWYASRHEGVAAQSFALQSGFDPAPVIEIYAVSPGGAEASETLENSVRLGLVAQTGGGAMLRLSWNGPRFSPTTATGVSTMSAPDQLDRAINFVRS